MNAYPCDICHEEECIEIPHCREYTSNEAIHICRNCGFVYVKYRKSAEEIANFFSKEIFEGGKEDQKFETYTARIPAIKARQTYVVGLIESEIGLKNKDLCEIGTGEGQLLEIARGHEYQANVFGIEPSPRNCQWLSDQKISHFQGILEEFEKSKIYHEKKFDIVTMAWTLVNSFSCRDMITTAYHMLKPGGYLVAAESSRILVPFKKPLHLYFSKNPVDAHAFHFSANALKNLLKMGNFEIVHVNRYIDSDVLCVIGQKVNHPVDQKLEKDNYLEVCDFFERWHRETQKYYKTTK